MSAINVANFLEYILGTDGDDLIDETWPGRSNPDDAENILALKGNDAVFGLGGDDSIDGGPGDDTINGGAGNDTYAGGDGSDRYIYAAGDGADTLIEGPDASSATDSVLIEGTLTDLAWGFDGDDLLVGAPLNEFGEIDPANHIRIVDQYSPGDHGIEYFEAHTAENNGFYTDQSVVPDGIARVYTPSGTSGTDQGPYFELILGTDGNDTMLGGGGYRDQFDAEAGNDLVIGSDVTLDRLFGGAGNDTLYGFGGNDQFRPQQGNDVIDGGDGNDRVEYSGYGDTGSPDAIHVDLNIQGTKQFISASQGWDTLINIESVRGSNFNDTLIGDENGNTLFGGQDDPFSDGNDLVFGKGGDDALFGIGGNDTLAGGAGADFAAGGAGDDSISGDAGDDVLDGEAGNDTIRGGNGQDQLYGGDGNDQLNGEGGDDTIDGGLGNDTVRGGAGSDLYIHDASAGFVGFDVVVQTEGDSGSVDTAYVGSGLYDLNYNREGNDLVISGAINENYDVNDTGSLRIKDHYISGTGGLDYFEGDTLVDNGFFTDQSLHPGDIARMYTPTGNNGQDQGGYTELIEGNSGNNQLRGNGGYRDYLYGNDGNDTLIGSNVTIDHLRGGDGNDVMRGMSGDDRLRPGAGNDIVDGGDGADYVQYDAATAGVTVDLGIEGKAQSIGADQGKDTLFSIEGVRGSQFGDRITGNSADNSMFGEGGDDTMAGSAGYDYFNGGTGNDSLIGGSGNDFFDPGEGNDRIDAGSGNDTVESGSGNGNDTVAGGDGLDIFYGGEGDDSASGGADADELSGRGGNDILSGDAGDDYIAGEDGNDTQRGGTGNDLMLGSIGDDQLFGEGDDDWLRGDEGNDTLKGGAGSDTYVQEAAAGFGGFDVIVQTGGDAATVDSAYFGSGLYDLDWYREGNDLVISGAINENYDVNDTGSLRIKDHYISGTGGLDYFEGDTQENNSFYTDQTLYPGGIARVYTPTGNNGQDQGGYTELIEGNSGNNQLRGNGGYRDYLYGNDGNDTLIGSDITIDHLRGGAGNDVLLGMSGDDRLRPGAGNDIVNGGDGIDRIEFNGASGGITVDLGIEGKAQTIGADQGKDTLFSIEEVRGSQFGDLMIGNSGDNFMIGEGGDDTMVGGAGLDAFLGGEGSDTFRFTAVSSGFSGFFDFTTGEGGDVLDVSAIIDFGESGLPLSEYLNAIDNGSDLLISVDTNGGGDNFQPLVTLFGATGQTIESLLAQGNLVVDESVVV